MIIVIKVGGPPNQNPRDSSTGQLVIGLSNGSKNPLLGARHIHVSVGIKATKVQWKMANYLKGNYWDVLLVLRINGLFHPYMSWLVGYVP